jgi:hypothetical protein
VIFWWTKLVLGALTSGSRSPIEIL